MDPVATEAPAVKETVEKTVEDVHENAPLVPSETNEDVVKAPAEAEEDKKQPESEKSETAATEKTEELPLENGKEEAEVVCAEEKPAEPEVVATDESLKRKVDDDAKVAEEAVPEKKTKTTDVEGEAVEKTAEKPVAEPEALPEQEATA